MPEQSSLPFIESLRRLALNLRWSWHHPTTALFAKLDPVQWVASAHNPVAMLNAIGNDRLAAMGADHGLAEQVAKLDLDLRSYLEAADTWYHLRRETGRALNVAYFSAEF